MTKGTKAQTDKKPETIEILRNRRAGHFFHIGETYEAGIVLKGTEVKSLRDGRANLTDAFARVDNAEVFLHGLEIQPYQAASFSQHEPKAVRKLLLRKPEINRLYAAASIKGQTIVALRLYWKNRRVKVEIAVGKGKVEHDKRDDLKKKVATREMQRAKADFNRKHG